jgi:hypothetical protein
MSLRYVKHFDLNIVKLADNLILHGNLFQRMAELCANEFHNYVVNKMYNIFVRASSLISEN